MKAVVSLAVLWAVSLCPGLCHAQTSTRPILTVKVPFEFVVGNRTFPAGTYKFQSLLNSVAGKDAVDVLTVRSTEATLYQAVVTDVVVAREPAKSRLVFTRNGGRTFLSEVWEPGKPAGCRLHNHKDQPQTAVTEEDRVTLLASADWR
jgi:hypothetical protein